MIKIFINSKHEAYYNEFLCKDRTEEEDLERKTLFYICAGNEELRRKVDLLYNFKERVIMPESFKIDMFPCSYPLVKLAFNLYNNLNDSLSINHTFRNLDSDDFRLAVMAISMRFNKLDFYNIDNIDVNFPVAIDQIKLKEVGTFYNLAECGR